MGLPSGGALQIADQLHQERGEHGVGIGLGASVGRDDEPRMGEDELVDVVVPMKTHGATEGVGSPGTVNRTSCIEPLAMARPSLSGAARRISRAFPCAAGTRS